MERRCSLNRFLLFGLCFGIWLVGCSTSEDPESPGPIDLCDPDPCEVIEDAVPGTCDSPSQSIFSCVCEEGHFWTLSPPSCPEDLCYDDPCDDIENAEAGSCEMPTTTSYTCDCVDPRRFFWDIITEACVDPCADDPCDGKEHATGRCHGLGPYEYACECQTGYMWYGGACQVDPCVPDPCDEIPNAESDSCQRDNPYAFTCECVWDPLLELYFFWDEDTDTCKDPCASHPCDTVPHATECQALSAYEYECKCEEGYFWEEIGETCEDPCALNPCNIIDNAVEDSCTGTSADEYDCECEEGFIWEEITETCVGPCDQDPCVNIDDAVPDTCEVVGEEEFTCECDLGFSWDPDTDSCTADACDPDPCEEKENAVPGTCTPVGEEGFECECELGLSWDSVSSRCTSCENFRECLLNCNPFFNLYPCANSCDNNFDDNCDCEFGLEDPAYRDCQRECNVTIDQIKRWECEVDCLFRPCLVIE